MKIVFDEQSHHSVEFDEQTPPTTRNGAKSEMSQEEQRVVFEMQERWRENGREVEIPREVDEVELVQSPHPTEFEEISPVTNSLRYSWSQHSFLPVVEAPPQIYRLQVDSITADILGVLSLRPKVRIQMGLGYMGGNLQMTCVESRLLYREVF
jgi:hypothetical protein